MPDGVPDGTVAVQYKYFGLQSQNDKIGPLQQTVPIMKAGFSAAAVGVGREGRRDASARQHVYGRHHV